MFEVIGFYMVGIVVYFRRRFSGYISFLSRGFFYLVGNIIVILRGFMILRVLCKWGAEIEVGKLGVRYVC